jgi:DNA-binding GntR family transcriptional regulator
MAPSVQRIDPPFMQVVAQIREQIQSGSLHDGDRVPSARQMIRDWSISLATATKVLAALQSEGLARAVPGIGTFVTTSATGAPPRDRLLSSRLTGRIYSKDEHAVIRAAALVPSPARVSAALGLSTEAPAIRRERVTYRGDVPTSASVSWYDGDLAAVAPKLLETDRIREGTPGYIADKTGRTPVAGRDEVGARVATEDDVGALQVEPGTAVLYGRNWYYDQAGVVLEYGEYVSLGDRLRSYEYGVEG